MKIRVSRLRELIRGDVLREEEKKKPRPDIDCSEPPPHLAGFFCPRHPDKELCVEWGKADKKLELEPEEEEKRQAELRRLGGIQPPTKDRPDLLKPTKTKRGGSIRALWCPLSFEPGDYNDVVYKDGKPAFDENGEPVGKPNRFRPTLGNGMKCDFHVGVSLQGMGSFASRRPAGVKYPMLGEVAKEEGVLGEDAELTARRTRTQLGKSGTLEKVSDEEVKARRAAAEKAQKIRRGEQSGELSPEEDELLSTGGRYERMAVIPDALRDMAQEMLGQGFHWKKREGARVPKREFQEREMERPTIADAIKAGIEDLTHDKGGQRIKSYKGQAKITMPDGTIWFARGREAVDFGGQPRPGGVDFKRAKAAGERKKNFSPDASPFERVPLEKDEKSGKPLMTQDDVSFLGWWYPQQLAQAEKAGGREYKGPKPYWGPRGKALANVEQNMFRLGWTMGATPEQAKVQWTKSDEPEAAPAPSDPKAVQLARMKQMLGDIGGRQGEKTELSPRDLDDDDDEGGDVMMPNPETRQQARLRGGNEAVRAWERDNPGQNLAANPQMRQRVFDDGAKQALRAWKPEVADPDFTSMRLRRQRLSQEGPSLRGCIIR